MTIDAECRICGTSAKQHPTTHDEFHQVCPRCGEFRITGTADGLIVGHRRKLPDWTARQAKLSGWLRGRNVEGDVPRIGSEDLRRIEKMPLPDPEARLDLLLRHIHRHQKTLGDRVQVAPSKAETIYGMGAHPAAALVAATWSENRSEVEWLLQQGEEEGLLRRVELHASLTAKGMKRALGNAPADEAPSSGRLGGSGTRAVIMTALPAETAAVLAHLDGRSHVTHEGTVFHTGRFNLVDVAVVEAGAGNAPAAALCERALGRFGPKVALFVGVAGGIKDVAIGDVVVGTKVYRYEAGKQTADGFLPRPDNGLCSHAVDQRARLLIQSGEWRNRIRGVDPPSGAAPKLRVGAILAGEKVVATSEGELAETLKRNYGDALAIEMEGRGFLDGVHLHAGVLAGVVRGISDLLEGKSAADASGSQEFAAAHAAAVAFSILDGLPG